jgi:serine phosphatase RsbU (regulator of sigma subunit)
MRYLFLISILHILVIFSCFSQQNQAFIDSLSKELGSVKEDTNRVNVLNALSYSLANTDPEKSRNYATNAISLSQKLNYNHGFASGIDMIGTYHERLGDYAKALEYKLQALRIHEQINDIAGISRGLNNIGVLYFRQKNFDKALEYYEKALEIAKRRKKQDAIAVYLLNIGEVYQEKGNYDKAIEYEEQSMAITRTLKDMEDCVAFSLGIIGQCYSAQGKYDKALVNMKRTVEIFGSINDKVSLAEYLIDLGNVYKKTGNMEQAIIHFERAIKVAEEIKDNNWLRDAHLGLAETYALQQNFGKAYTYHEEYNRLKDIVFNEDNAKRIAQMQTLYEADKRQAEIELLRKDNQIQEEENRIAKLFMYSFLITVIFIGSLAFVLYKNNKNKQKANLLLIGKNREIELKNAELEQQKEEILAQRDLVEEQNLTLQIQQNALQERNKEIEKQRNDITASITYAKRIQTAILPDLNRIKENFPQSFIFYKPRDIVSGDFYYFAAVQEAGARNDGSRGLINKIVLAVVDCTGHGVPGAFMSMIGDAMLNQITNIQRITSPDLILNELHAGVRLMLKQQDGENRDGMDISICTIDLTSRTLEFAGARNPIYIIKNGELIEIKANRFSIGGYQHEEERIFQKVHLKLDAVTTIYLSTDGYKDQFGSTEGKKFSANRLKELFRTIHPLDMKEQQDILSQTFEDWKGKEAQIDDVLVMGIKV